MALIPQFANPIDLREWTNYKILPLPWKFTQNDQTQQNKSTNIIHYPFQNPAWLLGPRNVLGTYAFGPLVLAVQGTGTGLTSIPLSVLQFPPHLQLRVVKQCSDLVPRLVHYSGTNLTVQDVWTNGYEAIQWTTWRERSEPRPNDQVPGLPPLTQPDVQDQCNAIDLLWIWVQEHAETKARVVHSEASVADQIWMQLLRPLNYLLKWRYRNVIGSRLNPRVGVTAHSWPNLMTPTRPFIPTWGRAPPVSLRPKLTNENHSQAGIPDFVLFAGPTEDSFVAIVEVKTFWACKDEKIRSLFGRQGPLAAGGNFVWGSPRNVHQKILVQIWSQMCLNGADWGVFTNGRLAVVCTRTSQQELTFSEVYDLESDGGTIFCALAGMQFAAIDGRAFEDPEYGPDAWIVDSSIKPFIDRDRTINLDIIEGLTDGRQPPF